MTLKSMIRTLGTIKVMVLLLRTGHRDSNLCYVRNIEDPFKGL